VNVLAVLGYAVLIGAGVALPWVLVQQTKTGYLPPLDENPHQEEVTFP
jgi:hypothetical protein